MLRRAALAAAASATRVVAGAPSKGRFSYPRGLVTSAQKRALNKQQLSGEQKPPPEPSRTEAATSAAAADKAAGTPAAGAAASPPPAGKAAAGGPGGKGTGPAARSSPIIPVLAILGLGGGAAYYFGVIPDIAKKEEEELEIGKTLVKAVEKKITKPAAVEEETAVEEKKKTGPKADQTKKEDTADEGGNRVINISFPPIDLRNRPPQVVPPPVAIIAGGNQVSVEKLNSEFFSSLISDEKAKKDDKKKSDEPVVVEAAKKVKESVATTMEKAATAIRSKSTVTADKAAVEELQTKIEDATSKELRSAHLALRTNLDEGLLKDLDKLSQSELKIRVVQLASEMTERTKWEAVRFKEFLAMKEKETAEKYLEILQKQRLEFEDLLARRLREQEDALTRQANAALQAKEDAIQSVLAAALEAQEAEHKLHLGSESERMKREFNAKYETEFRSKLAEAKADFSKALEEKVAVIESLTGRLRNVESKLEVSRNFESGSQRAHRISAAALALGEKLETSKSAAVELAALQAAAGDDGVIASALTKIPSSVKTGVPTLSELQAKFDKVYAVSRQAALVPEGRKGLEGQILGKLFSTLTIPPSPDSVPPPAEDGTPGDVSADYILARAQKHVQLGELDMALEQLDKLKGQAAFTVKDWKRDAKDRIAVDKALRVIKMECALLNKNMSGSGSEE